MRDPQSLIRLRRNESIALHPIEDRFAVGNSRLCKDQSTFIGDIWMVGLDGASEQWTYGEYNDTAPAFGDDGTLFFLSNRPTGQDDNHEKRRQVFAFGPNGGECFPVTDEPLGVNSFRVAGKNLVLVAPRLLGAPTETMRKDEDERKKHGPSARRYTQMPVRFWDHWIPAASPHFVLWTPEGIHDLTPEADRDWRMAGYDVTPDGRWMIASRSRVDTDRLTSHELTLFDLESKENKAVLFEPRTAFWSPTLSHDGMFVVAQRHHRTDDNHGGNELVRIDIQTGESVRLEDSSLDIWPSPQMFTAPNTLLCVAENQGRALLYEVDCKSGDTKALTHEASIVAVDARAELKVALMSSILRPAEPFRVGDEVELICSISGYDPDDDIVVEEMTVESTDGVQIQGFVVKRRDTLQAPCLMAIHGGPIASWNDAWLDRWNARLLAERGYVVALPNPRGSTGFGQAFVEGIWGNEWGGQCFEDLMCFADALEVRTDVDESKMVALGGSFGGFMTNWIGCHTNRFSCLISHAGLTNLSGFHGVTDLPAWWIHMFGESPYDPTNAFDRYSPFRHLDGWETPVLIIHGQMDYRVPVGEALVLFDGLQAREVPSELLIFPDENHWILKPRNSVTWYEAVFEFVGRHVG